MKANELMIGDYMRINRDGLCIKKGTIVEVRGIDADEKLIEKGLIGSTICHPLDDNQFDGGIWCEYLDPIPITPEILEKNGWKEAQFWHEYQDGKNTIQSCLPDMRGIINGVEIQHFKCEYVHQYQHLLRLCGIEKEIVL